jgi:hypothetical protein
MADAGSAHLGVENTQIRSPPTFCGVRYSGSGYASCCLDCFCAGLIAVTEPRRVAAISMSERVGRELNDPSLTGYQIRYTKIPPPSRPLF